MQRAPFDTPPKAGGYSGRTVLGSFCRAFPRSPRVGPIFPGPCPGALAVYRHNGKWSCETRHGDPTGSGRAGPTVRGPASLALDSFRARHLVLEANHAVLDLDHLQEQSVLHTPGAVQPLVDRGDLSRKEVLRAQLATEALGARRIEHSPLLNADFLGQGFLAAAVDDPDRAGVDQRRLDRREHSEHLIVDVLRRCVLDGPDGHHGRLGGALDRLLPERRRFEALQVIVDQVGNVVTVDGDTHRRPVEIRIGRAFTATHGARGTACPGREATGRCQRQEREQAASGRRVLPHDSCRTYHPKSPPIAAKGSKTMSSGTVKRNSGALAAGTMVECATVL